MGLQEILRASTAPDEEVERPPDSAVLLLDHAAGIGGRRTGMPDVLPYVWRPGEDERDREIRARLAALRARLANGRAADSPVTAVILIAAALIAIAGVLIIAATTTLRRLLARERAITGHAAGPGQGDDLTAGDSLPKRGTRLDRLLSDHELAEAMNHVATIATGEADDCDCWWAYLPGGEAQMFPCGRHEAMLRAVREAGL
jgi:hypothetical protein